MHVVYLENKIVFRRKPLKQKNANNTTFERMDLDEIPEHIPESKGRISSSFRNVLILYSATMVMVLARSVDFVLFIRMAKKMTNYEYILADVLLPVGFMCSM
jgi:hypothetical protein